MGKKGLQPYESVQLAQLPVEKAGFVIYGKNAEGQLCVLTTYTQGRFDDSANKFYGLAKGAIDRGESSIDAACRETFEETGIDPKALLGPQHFQQLAAGGDVTPKKPKPGAVPLNKYGVTVTRAYSQPSDFAYTSASGHQRRLHTYFIEVDNIDALDQRVKMPPASKSEKRRRRRVPEAERFTSESPMLEYTVQQHLEQRHYPDLQEMMGMLRSGTLGRTDRHGVKRKWTPQDTATIIPEPHFAELEQRWIAESGRAMTQITSQSDWLDFCRATERDHKPDYKQLEKDFSALKNYFSSTGICGDRTFIKLDEKDRPLHFFFEGGEVIPLHKFLTRSSAMAETNKTYRDATWGEFSGKIPELLTNEQLAFRAQIGGILPRDGQRLGFSEIYSTEAARVRLHEISAMARACGKDLLAYRVGGLAAVLDQEAKAR